MIETQFMFLQILYFKILMNFSTTTTTDFPSLYAECISSAFFSNHDFVDLLKNSLPLSINILFGFLLDSFKIS